jgi:hydrogenase-4 component F
MIPSWPILVALVPVLAAAILAAMPRREWGQWGNLGASALGFAMACRLPWVTSEPGGWLFASPTAIHMVLLGSFVGLTAAWFSRAIAPPGRLRLYHALFQILLGSTDVALLSDNAVLTWAALEIGVLALVVATLLPGTPDAQRAAWRVLLLASSALVLTAFGTFLLYLAATPALGPGWDALRWSALTPAASRFDGPVLSLAFVLMLLGYGGVAGLAPLHLWLLDAQGTPPAALGGVLGGALPGVALIVILRLRGILDGNAQAVPPDWLIMALGLAALLISAAGLWRVQDERRWLALSSVGQNGIVAVAFGLGGATATLAGLVHLTAHTLAKAAAFQASGVSGRWTLRIAVAAVAGLPPFGLFSGLVLVMEQAVQRGLALGLALGVGIAASSWALMVRVRSLGTTAGSTEVSLDAAGAWACLAAALAMGLTMPAPLADWLRAMAAAAQ